MNVLLVKNKNECSVISEKITNFIVFAHLSNNNFIKQLIDNYE